MWSQFKGPYSETPDFTLQTLGLSPSRSGEAFLMTEQTSKPRGEQTEPHL